MMEIETTPEIVKKYQLGNVEHVAEVAVSMQAFIEKNKLSTVIQGKNYVLCDGWKFAGLNFGIIPQVKRPEDKSDGNEKKYTCECDLVHMTTKDVVGYGFAICSNAEKSKKNFDEYAVASMAQTRAISKAYRNLLGFVMLAAGFEDTPAEEMTEDLAKGTNATVLEFDQEAKDIVDGFDDYEELLDWSKDMTRWHNCKPWRIYVQACVNMLTLQDLWGNYGHELDETDHRNIERIIANKEVANYKKAIKTLQEL